MKAIVSVLLLAICAFSQEKKTEIPLPSSKVLMSPAPGAPRKTNSFPVAMALSPDGKWLAMLNAGHGTEESELQQSISILNTETDELRDFPDARLGQWARQTYFHGIAWSGDGTRVYASIASLTDPEGREKGSTGEGIAVYAWNGAQLQPQAFWRIPLQRVATGKRAIKIHASLPEGKLPCYPAGIARTQVGTLVMACNLSDSVLVISEKDGSILHTIDVSTAAVVPAAYPLEVEAHNNGERGYVGLWNASSVAVLDLKAGRLEKNIAFRRPKHVRNGSVHPAALRLGAGELLLHVTLAQSDEVATVSLKRIIEKRTPVRYFSTRLAGQKHGGAYPIAIVEGPRAGDIYVANAGSNSIAHFDLRRNKMLGFIPTEWYPTALALKDGSLYVATGKGKGSGPNNFRRPIDRRKPHAFIASLLYGSLAKIDLAGANRESAELTQEVQRSNLMGRPDQKIRFARGRNPIRHVIYVVKENRTYDQMFGDLGVGNGDPKLTMFGEDIAPNHRKLARQFGVLDNFYDSGEVSGDGHVWTMAATSSDYTEKTWQIGYRSRERTYDYEGVVSNSVPMHDGIPDVNEPGSGYLWALAARHGKTFRHFGEFVKSKWCNTYWDEQHPSEGTPVAPGAECAKSFVNKGESFPPFTGTRGSVNNILNGGAPSPWPWPVPILYANEATKPELVGNFSPHYADYRIDYPDQLRADVFLAEFNTWVAARKAGKRDPMPQLIVLRLPNDHTAGTRPGMPTPQAAIADNDLALGRVVEAVSNSPYWNDTAILVLEDDAQDGADHVDAHRSIAFVISKYSPSSIAKPVVDSNFYTTVSMIRTLEVLLGLPPMNNNDAQAPVIAPLFTGAGNQPPFVADYRNRDNRLLYATNKENAPGAKASIAMDFDHADQVDTAELNAILWRLTKGDLPQPAPVHTMCGR